jgi:hypothetical protein
VEVNEGLKQRVRDRYAEAARSVLGEAKDGGSCCGVAESEERAGRLATLRRALSDPIRVTMLGMLSEGRGCCELPDCGVPAGDQDAGICVCEFERYFDHNSARSQMAEIRAKERLQWSFLDPSKATDGYEERLRAFRNVRDRIQARIEGELAKGGV